MINRVRKWKYVNLADLIGDHSPDYFNHHLWSGDCCNFGRYSEKILHNLILTDLATGIQYSHSHSENTRKEEAAGLAAHSYLIIQLSRDLSGSQWLKHDQQFREWTVA